MAKYHIHVKRAAAVTLLSVVLIGVLAVASNIAYNAFPELKPDIEHIRRHSLAVSIIIFAVLPSIYEELIFRGLILGFLRKQMPDYGAVLISSLLFAVVHWGISQSAAAFVWGLFLAMVMIRTRSVVFCMYAHLLNNLAFLIIR